MRNALGFDLNGLWDFATEGDGENEPILKDLGIRGSIVRLVAGQNVEVGTYRWIGGLQAALAPHGRGPGWGREIGGAENRIFWADVLKAIASDCLTQEQAEAVTMFLDGLVEEPSSVHVAVPDAASFDEPARDRLLRLLSQTRRLRSTLLWRPIAAILGWLEEPIDHRGFQPEPDMRIGVLSLMSGGIQFADAKLVRERWRETDLWVPERSEAGLEVRQACAGEVVVERGILELATRMQAVDEETLSTANTPWRFSVGERPGFELIRLPNRSWRRVPDGAMPRVAISRTDIPEEFLERVAATEALIIEGPMAGNETWAQTVLQAIGVPDVPAFQGGGGLVASGCLSAALRAAAGAPVYYDFLPQLEINALVGGEPRFVELIPKHKRLPGGMVYRGAAPGDFSIGKGAVRPVFFLFKEDFPTGRKAEVNLPEEADKDHRIFVSVEQSPGQGFAQVRVASDTFEALRRRPIELDWSTMELVDQTKEEILESLSGQRGLSYPDAVSTPGHPFLWYSGHPKGDLLGQLQAYIDIPLIRSGDVDHRGRKALQALRERFSKPETPSYVARRMGLDCNDLGSFRALDSDGYLPETNGEFRVPEGAENLLNAALKKVGNELKEVLAHRRLRNNEKLLGDIVGFASWCFWRSPASVTELLLAKYGGRSEFPVHHTLYREGLGRVVHSAEELVEYFDSVDRRLEGAGKLVAAEFSAIGRVLGTCHEAAEVLRTPTANMILQETCEQLDDENNVPREDAYKRRFKASLLMLAALLRHRRVRPNFIDPEGGIAGRTLINLLVDAQGRNEQFKMDAERLRDRARGPVAAKHNAAARRFERNADILHELIAMIHGEGSDPNIIRKIDEMEDDHLSASG